MLNAYEHNQFPMDIPIWLVLVVVIIKLYSMNIRNANYPWQGNLYEFYFFLFLRCFVKDCTDLASETFLNFLENTVFVSLVFSCFRLTVTPRVFDFGTQDVWSYQHLINGNAYHNGLLILAHDFYEIWFVLFGVWLLSN